MDSDDDPSNDPRYGDVLWKRFVPQDEEDCDYAIKVIAWLRNRPTNSRESSEDWFHQNFIESQAGTSELAATQLYDSNTGLIYELIQNADDALFKRAQRRGELPFMKISIHENYLTVETNEDGFTLTNVHAICATGLSDKGQDPETTGEKGIGFKSVFSVASGVEIQSGNWSFQFQYDGTNSSGMNRPMLKQRDTTLSTERTQIRLHLRQNELACLIEELKNLPATCIMFLRKIRRLKIQISGSNTEFQRRRIEKVDLKAPDQQNMVLLKDRTRLPNEPDQPVSNQDAWYKTYSRNIRSMPTRTVPQTTAPNGSNQEQGRAGVEDNIQRPVELVLAFRVSEDGLPYAGPHSSGTIHAFLPCKEVPNLPFLIQSDFNTKANRQQIVDNERDKRILGQIAPLFISALQGFIRASEDTRCDDWLFYIPPQHLDLTGFEAKGIKFHEEIRHKLKDENVVKVRIEHSEQKVSLESARMLPEWSIYGEKEPIFKDLEDERLYISTEYTKEHLSVLRNLGVPYLSPQEMLRRVKRDLERKSESRWWRYRKNQLWYGRAMDMLLGHWEKPKLKPLIERLDLIPLADSDGNDWTSIQSCICRVQSPSENILDIYWPKFRDREMPLPKKYLKRLHPDTAASVPQQDFWQKLGVKECPEKNLIEAILALSDKREILEYTRHHIELTILLFESRLRLNLTVHNLTLIDEGNRPRHILVDFRSENQFHAEKLIDEGNRPGETSLYFRSENQFHAEKLLDTVDENPNSYLHSLYTNDLKYVIKDIDTQGWMDFLFKFCKVRYGPLLTVFDGRTFKLSPDMRKALEKGLRGFLGALKTCWSSEYSLISPKVSEELKNTQAFLSPLTTSWESIDFKRTYFPTEEVSEKCEEFGIASGMPILPVQGIDKVLVEDDWDFLKKIEVSFCRPKLTLDFWLDALKHLKDRTQEVPMTWKGSFDKACEIYKMISQEARPADYHKIKKTLKSYSLIHTDSQLGWCRLDSCVWDGLDVLEHIPRLKTLYHPVPRTELTDFPPNMFQNFFQTSLGVLDYDVYTIIDELLAEKKEFKPQKSKIARLYECIHECMKNAAEQRRTQVKEIFATHKLLYANNDWRKTSECIWSSPIKVPDRFDLEEQGYENLELFFVDIIGIEKGSISSLCNAWLRLARVEADVDYQKILEIIWKITLAPERDSWRSDTIAIWNSPSTPLWPVSRGIDGDKKWKLATSEMQFYFIDHERYGRLFRGRMWEFEMPVDQVTHLKPLLKVLGLDSHFLSSCVEESPGYNLTPHPGLTAFFQEMVPAISCVANHFGSSRYLDENAQITHRKLLNAQVFTTSSPALLTLTLPFDEDEDDEEEVKNDEEDEDEEDDEEDKDYVNFLYFEEDEEDNEEDEDYVYYEEDEVDEEYEEDEGIDEGSSDNNDEDDDEDDEEVDRLWIPILEFSDRQITRITSTANDTEICILLPGDERQRKSGIRSQLPLEIYKFLELEDSGALGCLVSLFTDLETSLVEILSHGDIPLLEWTRINSGNSTLPRVDVIRTTEAKLIEISDDLERIRLDSDSDETEERERIVFDETEEKESIVFDEIKYAETLKNLVAQAHRLDIDTAVPDRCYTFEGGDRSFRVGAAGELFVVELLRCQNLAHFTPEVNWQSNLRGYVKGVSRYKKLPPWKEDRGSNRGDNDIVYQDTDGRLGAWLEQGMQRCPGQELELAKSRFKYWIEVKSTTSPNIDTSFGHIGFTTNQFRRMYEFRLQDGRAKIGRTFVENSNEQRTTGDCAVFVRVWNLGGRAQYRIYVDPWYHFTCANPTLKVPGILLQPVRYPDGVRSY